MTAERLEELVALVEAAAPDDDAAALVLADQLSALGDPRGELIVLDALDRAGRLDRPDQLERLLLLAAEYTFPRREPELPPLPWECVDRTTMPDDRQFSVAYEVRRDAARYTFTFRRGALYFDIDGDSAMLQASAETDHHLDLPNATSIDANGVELFLGDRFDMCWWTEDEAAECMSVVCDWVRYRIPIRALALPFETLLETMGAHAAPRYESGPCRIAWLPSRYCEARRIKESRYALAGRDYHRWISMYRRLEAMRSR